jgi:segregation and condensation protein A
VVFKYYVRVKFILAKIINFFLYYYIMPDAQVLEEVDKNVNNLDNEEEFERDYSKMDLVELIDQPEWKTILIDLVKTNKMDPWNIDVTDLTEKYLEKINNMESSSLRVPANAILACAILVKTKSKFLKLSSLDEEEEEEQLSEEQKELFLEELPDLVASRSMREGRITLDELVNSIEGIISQNEPRKTNTRNIPRMELNFDTVSIEDKLDGVYDLIKNRVDSQGIVLFNDLVENNEDNHSIIDTFLPVLFLMNSGKILAYQEDFFGDIFVKLLKEENKKVKE